ncbi:MAG: hypothetical protein GY816_01030 [Cytophagales bacterium]|nr:hypothetical protein [Cytophagales bacterium]
MINYNQRINRFLISMVMGTPSYAIYALIRGFPLSDITLYAFTEYGLTAIIALFLIFEVQNAKANFLNKRMAWESRPWRRLWTELSSSFLITTAIVIACYAFLYLVIWDNPLWFPTIFLYTSLVYFVSLCFMVFVNASPLITSWKSSILKTELLEKQTVEAKLEALRTQLSPHFFFNNLSILNGLIEKHPDKAKDLIAKLSEVFRYILKHKNDEIVPLSEEVDFLKDYMFLIKSRFEEKVIFSTKIEHTNGLWIPPVTLQQLIENAVKHNEASYNKPLKINVYLENDHLVVINNLQERKGVVLSSSIGLVNIKKRFEMLIDKPVTISNDDEEYRVCLPLIKYDGSPHN